MYMANWRLQIMSRDGINQSPPGILLLFNPLQLSFIIWIFTAIHNVKWVDITVICLTEDQTFANLDI